MSMINIVKRCGYLALAFMVVSSCMTSSVYAITDKDLEKFSASNIMFYDPEASKECGPGGKSVATSVAGGDSVKDMIWNYAIYLGIEGFSDNPAAIAGFMGNYFAETGYDPFKIGVTKNDAGEVTGLYYGLHMWRGRYGANSMRRIVTEKVGTDLFTTGTATPTKEQLSIAVATELDLYFTGTTSGLKNDISYYEHNDEKGEPGAVDKNGKHLPTEKLSGDKASGTFTYFQSFMGYLKGEKKIDYSSNSIWTNDELLGGYGLKNGEYLDKDDPSMVGIAAASIVERSAGSDYEKRSNEAKAVYEEYSNKGGTSSTQTRISADLSNSEVYQGAKYNLTDDQKVRFLHVADHENNSSIQAIKTELSQMANNSEVHDKHDPGDVDGLIKTVTGGWYSVARLNSENQHGAYDDLTYAGKRDDGSIIHDSGFTPSEEYLAAIEDVLVNGNRVIPQQVVEHTSSYMATNDGVEIAIDSNDKYDRTQFVRGKTVIHDKTSDSQWIFWSFADQEKLTGDPFGYYESNPPTGQPSYKTSSTTEECPEGGISGDGGLPLNGLSLEQANELIETYKKEAKPWDGDPYKISPNDFPYTTQCSSVTNKAGCKRNQCTQGNKGCCGTLTNCVEFSLYFINKFTTANLTSGLPNGRNVVDDLLHGTYHKGYEKKGFVDGGNVPKAYAIFSEDKGIDPDTNEPYAGHTGVVLGFNGDNVIIGEAGCTGHFVRVRTITMAEASKYTYAYTDGIIDYSQLPNTSDYAEVTKDFYEDSDTVPCDPRTTDYGVYTHNESKPYAPGRKIRLCGISTMDSVDGIADVVLVSSRVSGPFYALGKSVMDTGGKIKVSSSFRTATIQKALAKCHGKYPEDGCGATFYVDATLYKGISKHAGGYVTWNNLWSPHNKADTHMLGTAIDFDDSTKWGSMGKDAVLKKHGFATNISGDDCHINVIGVTVWVGEQE